MKDFEASGKTGFLVSTTKYMNDAFKYLLFQWGLFSFGAHANGEYQKDTADYTFDEANSSMTLKGTQVIGYSCTLVPKYPTS